jgi:hypothetical protein
MQRERWRQMKARGKKSFILRVGVIRYGGFMFVVMTTLDLLRDKPSFPVGVGYYVVFILINLLVWTLGGSAFGLWMWRSYEKRFSETGG